MASLTLLEDLGKTLDYICKVSGTHRSTGATRTFYASVSGRMGTAANNNPGDVDIPPFLLDPGGFSDGLSMDGQFSGLAESSLRQIVWRNDSDDSGIGIELLDYDFNGEDIEVLLGEEGDDYDNFNTSFILGEIVGEPEVKIDRITWELATVLDRLDKPHPEVYLFAGQETALDCDANGANYATASSIDVYDGLSAYTIVWRMRYVVPVVGSPEFSILSRGTAATSRDFRLQITSSFNLSVDISNIADVVTSWGADKSLFNGLRYQTVAFSIDQSGYGELSIDGEVIEAKSMGSKPRHNTGKAIDISRDEAGGDPFLTIGKLDLMDVRIYDSFLTVSEILSLMSAPSSQLDPLVASWRCDDNSGDTLTDYSVNANHAVAAGALSFISSGEGDESYYGRGKGFASGWPRAVPAPLTSELHKTYHLPVDPNYTQRVVFGTLAKFKTKGLEIFDSNDPEVENSRNTVTLASLTNEPTTADLTIIDLEHQPRIMNLMEVVLQDAGLTVENADYIDAVLGQVFSGGWLEDIPTTRDIVSQHLIGVGANASQTRDGNVKLGFLSPPLSPSPFDEACVQLEGKAGSLHPAFNGLSVDMTGDFTICFWGKVSGFPRRPETGFPESLPSAFTISGSDGTFDIWWFGLDNKTLFLRSYADPASSAVLQSWTASLSNFQENEWIFCAVTFSRNGVNSEVNFYAGPGTSDFWQLSTKYPSSPSATISSVNASTTIRVGEYWVGSLCRVFVFNSALSRGDVEKVLGWENISTSANSIEFLLRMNEGEGDVEEEVNAETSIYPVNWVPQHRIHLEKTETSIPEEKRLTPSAVTEVRWARNWTVLDPGSTDTTTLTKTQQIDVQREYKSTAMRRPNGRETRVFDSTLLENPFRIVRLLDNRFSGKSVFTLESFHRPLLIAESGDEVWIQGNYPGWRVIRSVKIVNIDVECVTGRSMLVCWGESIIVGESEEEAEGGGNLLVNDDGENLGNVNGGVLSTRKVKEIE